MKKSILSLAVAAGVSSTAMAQMHINHQGLGEALVFPLYSAQNGNDTYIAIANTTTNAKAVKIRILEAENSVEVLDFNLYMSPEDHFSFAITANEDGGASLVTADNSCTVPQITGPVPFRTFNFSKDKAVDDPKTTTKDESFDNTGVARTQIGHIEVIEMGQIAYSTDPKSVYQATLHDEDGVPANCDAHTALWSVDKGTPGKWLEAVSNMPPTEATLGFQSVWNGGGLYGYGQVVNVAEGTAFGYDAIAIDGLVESGNTGAAMHEKPGSILPNFNDSAIDNTVMVESGLVEVAGDEIEAVSALFQATVLENDYVIDEDINALTDWVVTHPTKFYHTQGTAAVAPFNATWDGQKACEPTALETWDREEAYVPPPVPGSEGPDFSPAPPPTTTPDDNNDLPLCYETNIVQFGADSAIGAENVVIGVGPRLDYSEGWARLQLNDGLNSDGDPLLDSGDDTTGQVGANDRSIMGTDANSATTYLQGLPVAGFAVIKYTNSSANEAGALANYAVSTEHKTTTATS
jgi:hypothetical protein